MAPVAEEMVKALKSGMSMLKRKDDDAYDRLSNRYTIGFLLATSLFLATKTYVGDPIDCWVPNEFELSGGNKNWVKYTDNYCWVKNTYYVAPTDNLPGPKSLSSPDHSSAPEKELPYYQWVPIILAAMMLTFAIPVYFWQFAIWTSGYDVESVIKVVSTSENVDPLKRYDTIKYVVAQLDRHISYHRRLNSLGHIPLGSKFGRYLYIMHVFTKLLYIGVALGLFFLLTTMMGAGYIDYGVRVLKDILLNDGSYQQNPMFPRVTQCNFAIRKTGGNIHRYHVQCVLTVNLFSEKIFLVIWWWLIILASLSTLGLLVSLIKTLRPNGGIEFVTKYLTALTHVDIHNQTDRQLIKHFTGQYLCLDGVFYLRLIAQNTTDVIAAEIVAALYARWKEEHADKSAITESENPLSDDKNK